MIFVRDGFENLHAVDCLVEPLAFGGHGRLLALRPRILMHEYVPHSFHKMEMLPWSSLLKPSGGDSRNSAKPRRNAVMNYIGRADDENQIRRYAMLSRRSIMVSLAAFVCLGMTTAQAAPSFTFRNIDGGEISLEDLRGGPVLVVNTASRCGFTYQYDGLQTLYDAYRDKGLTVLTVPSDAFNQELATNEAVKDFCEVNFGLTMPMTEMEAVTGPSAHPFYVWLRETAGFVPTWNFNKVLLDASGEYVDSWGSSTKPMSPLITKKIEAALSGS
jgi:glutathione peroxidase